MSSGKEEPEMLETINQADVEEERFPLYPVFFKLNKNFEVIEIYDNYYK